MKKRIFSSIFLVAISLMAVITTIVAVRFYSSYKSSQIDMLKNEASLVIKGVENDGISYFDDMTFSDHRITLIDSDGSVLYDSNNDSTSMENHLEREEVKEAIETGYGESNRYSDTIMKTSYYVAYKLSNGSILRLSYTTESTLFLVLSTLYPIFYALAAALIVSLILSYLISKKIVDPLIKLDLNNPNTDNVYSELKPLVEKLSTQHNQLIEDKAETEKNSLLRQEFTANVSHEMKTPLHVISGYSELIKEGMVEGDDVKTFASKIHDEANRLSKLVEDIMQLSKLDNGITDKEKEKLKLDQVVGNAIESLEAFASESNVEIKSKLEMVDMYGIPDIIHGIAYNLIDNAIKYNTKGGQVEVVTYNEGCNAILEVKDTGIGIPSESLDRIFERFYRVDKSHSREIGGTGLGLSIVKHAVKVHNAEIKVDSEVGVGTKFKVIFPKI